MLLELTPAQWIVFLIVLVIVVVVRVRKHLNDDDRWK